MARKKRLRWGQTPWDHMTREELLPTVQRMYAATEAMYSCLNMQRALDQARNPQNPYWGADGTGGIAHEMGRQVRDAVLNEYHDEDVYRCFFRYARDLLFDTSRYRIGGDWLVCEQCGVTWGRASPGPTRCMTTDCPGTLRPLTWDDLQPCGALPPGQ